MSASRCRTMRRDERAAILMTAAATIWFALAASWGLFGPIGGGHDAVVASRGIIAENMLHWRIGSPVREYTLGPPTPNLIYANHPWGTFWYIASFVAMFGRHVFVPRLAAVVVNAAAPPLLYGIGRALWGPVPGALAALAYATLPITLAFGDFPGFEGPLVTACLLTTWAYLRFAREKSAKWMALSLLGVVLVANADWEGQIFIGAVIVGLSTHAFFGRPRGWTENDVRAVGRWAVLAAFLAGGTVLAYLLYFQSIEAIGGLVAQESRRTAGNALALSTVLSGRRFWIDVTFTPLAVLVGKIALPVFLARLLLLRRTLEVFALALLVMAIVQYVRFKNGADIHIYWPLPFAPYYALSVGVLAATAQSLGRLTCAVLGREEKGGAVGRALVFGFGLIPLAIVPDGIDGLRFARMSGGRFDEGGRRAPRDVDKSLALEWMAQRMGAPSTVNVHDAMKATWAQAWALHRPMRAVTAVPSAQARGDGRYFVADLRFVSEGAQLELAKSFHLSVVGPYVLADLDPTHEAGADGFVFDEREPNALEWYLVSGVDPIRTIRPDPFYTWELREHYGQAPNDPPSSPPRTLDQLRIAHNIAIASGDLALAERYERDIVAMLDVSVATTDGDGTRLLGELYSPGVEPELSLFFLAAERAQTDHAFEVMSIIEGSRPFSLVPVDDKAQPVGVPFTFPPRLWKKGFIYVSRTPVWHRPGRERFVGFFSRTRDFSTHTAVAATEPKTLLRVE